MSTAERVVALASGMAGRVAARHEASDDLQRTVESFLHQAQRYAKLDPSEVRFLRPIVEEVVSGEVDLRTLLDRHRDGKLGPAVKDLREKKPGEAGTDVMSPLGLAMAFLYNNFRRLAPANPRRASAIGRGQTVETGTWRIHRYAQSVKATDLTNAGKRGQKVYTIAIYLGLSTPAAEEDLGQFSEEVLSHAKRNARFDDMRRIFHDAEQVIYGAKVEIITERGVDVVPAGFRPI